MVSKNETINSNLKFYSRWKISDHDIIFWCGDMNYRISEPNEQVRKAIKEFSTIPLQEKDQLLCEKKLDHIFTGYYEPPINFMPTYKFDINTDEYDTSEKLRTPSWTDRILYRPKRSKVLNDNKDELESIQTIHYSCANNIKFSDHRPVSGLYLVVIKYKCDENRSSRIREELIREFDRLENESIPTIEVKPRPPEIKFSHIRYLDKPNYPLLIKNVGECPCICSILPSPISPSYQYLTFTPNAPYTINVKQEQHVNISLDAKTDSKPISEILILHVENGADTFITLDVTFDKGPFGLSLDEYPPTLYDNKNKKYIYSIENKSHSENIVEMINDPPILYIALIDCLEERKDINLLYIFNNETQDSLDLIPLRDQLYENNYNFTNYSTAELFMILLHLLQSLPQPLISFDIQDKIFFKPNQTLSRQEDMTKAVSIVIEQLKAKERNLFFRFLLLLQKCWPTKEQIKKTDDESGDILNVCIDILALSILHEHLDRNQRHAFILACLNEEKKR
jgi:phosphatidylinositol-bisphosphatase